MWIRSLALLFFFIFYIGTVLASIDAKIILCGVCKNAESSLDDTITSIEELVSNFNDYRVFIYENNSRDNTRTILKAWHKKNSKVSILCEDFSEEELKSFSIAHTWDSKPCRIEITARARNIVLYQAMSSDYHDYEYVLMMDMDTDGKWNIEGILSSFNLSVEWDAIIANGILSNEFMWDYYSWRDDYRVPFGPEVVGDFFWNNIWQEKMKFDGKHDLIPVYSAFGGLAIYKRDSIQNCNYKALPCYELEWLFSRILDKSRKKNGTNKYIKNYERRNKNSNKINFINNSGYEVPIVSHHLVFHAQMIAKGYNKIFVNPKMVYYHK
jgi:hypothetical protein